jgi:hypothetical protein
MCCSFFDNVIVFVFSMLEFPYCVSRGTLFSLFLAMTPVQAECILPFLFLAMTPVQAEYILPFLFLAMTPIEAECILPVLFISYGTTAQLGPRPAHC